MIDGFDGESLADARPIANAESLDTEPQLVSRLGATSYLIRDALEYRRAGVGEMSVARAQIDLLIVDGAANLADALEMVESHESGDVREVATIEVEIELDDCFETIDGREFPPGWKIDADIELGDSAGKKYARHALHYLFEHATEIGVDYLDIDSANVAVARVLDELHLETCGYVLMPPDARANSRPSAPKGSLCGGWFANENEFYSWASEFGDKVLRAVLTNDGDELVSLYEDAMLILDLSAGEHVGELIGFSASLDRQTFMKISRLFGNPLLVSDIE